jgi:biopolymer transport protein ExbB
MTALGLVVAVPAVLAYNWLIRRNKTIMEDLGAFTNDVHGYLASAGAVKPIMGGATPPAQTRSGAAPTQRGAEPVRAGMTPTGAQATPTPTR